MNERILRDDPLFPKVLWVSTKQIGEKTETIRETLTCDALSALLSEKNSALAWRALEPTTLEARVCREADAFRLQGSCEITVRSPCVRCLEDVDFKYSIRLNLRLFERVKPVVETSDNLDLFLGHDGDISEGSEDNKSCAIEYFSDGIIDVPHLLRTQIFLDLPAYPKCDHKAALQTKACNAALDAVSSKTTESLGKLIPLIRSCS